MRLKIILRYVGVSLMMISVLMLVAGIVACLDKNDFSDLPLLFSAMITFVVGTYPMIFVRPSSSISLKEGYAIVVGSWVAACLFGMLPYLCYGGEFTFTNALFESVSGFTTTGASILNDIESLPIGLKLWRMETAWVGGIGIVTIFSLLVPRAQDSRSVLTGAEISGIARNQTAHRGKKFVYAMLSVYFTMTMLCFGSLMLAGLGWFDALTNAMSACSTCGFCVRNASIAAYDNLAAEIVLTVFMILAGMSFIGIYSVFSGKDGKKFLHSEVLRTYLMILLVGTLVMTADLSLKGVYDSIPEALRAASFQMSSIMTTTGFATADTTKWPVISIMVILFASIVCGCSGSTSGGIKSDRLVMFVKGLRRDIRHLMNPRVVGSTRLDGSIVKDSMLDDVRFFVAVYLIMVAAGAVINIFGGLDVTTGITASIACAGNVGPGFGSAGSFGNYADFPVLLKYNSMLLMLAGRVEIMPFLFVVFQYWHRDM